MYKETQLGKLYTIIEIEDADYFCDTDQKRYSLLECNWVDTPEGISTDAYIDLATEADALTYFNIRFLPLIIERKKRHERP